MTTRTFILTTVLVAATSGSLPAQTPAPAAQPGQAPRAPSVLQTPEMPRPKTAITTPEGPPPPPPPPAPTTGAPRRTGQPINIRVDVTVTDQRGSAAPVKKTMSVVTADAMGGRIRSQVSYAGPLGDVPLNIDTEPTILADGKIRVIVNLQYDLPGGVGSDSQAGGTQRKTQIQENLALVLENGKSLVAAQSADPVGDRQVTVEVKATILR